MCVVLTFSNSFEATLHELTTIPSLDEVKCEDTYVND